MAEESSLAWSQHFNCLIPLYHTENLGIINWCKGVYIFHLLHYAPKKA